MQRIKYRILGCPCLAMRETDAATQMIALIEEKKAGYTVAINAEKIQRFDTDPLMRNIILGSILPYPDGAGAVLGLKWLFDVDAEKINMPITALAVADKAKLRVFIIGADEKNHELAVKRIAETYRNIQLVGHLHGFEARELMLSEVLTTKPQIILIAMGSPKQEVVAAELMAEANFGLAVGCGGALDILSGSVRRAPTIMVNNNLEWLYRLYKNPWRIQRQLVLPKFLIRLVVECFKRKVID